MFVIPPFTCVCIYNALGPNSPCLKAHSVTALVSIGAIVMTSVLLTEYPVSLRIGPAVHDYTYTYIGAGVYKCARGSGWARHLRLFLVCHDGFWYAVDAPLDSSWEDIMRQGVPIFRSSEAVLEPGWHTWERNMKAHDGSVIWKATGLCAVTMILTSEKYERDC